MKTVIILIVLAAAGYFTYDNFFAAKMSSSYKTYEKLADYLDNDEFGNALAMASGNSGIEAMTESRHEWVRTNKLSIRETLRKVDFDDRGKDYASFTILQKTYTNPSTTPPGTADYLITQEVELEKDDEDDWVIVQFSEVIEQFEVEN